MDNLVNTKVNHKLDLSSTLDAVGGLLRNLSSLNNVVKGQHGGEFLMAAQFEKVISLSCFVWKLIGYHMEEYTILLNLISYQHSYYIISHF